MKLLFRPAYPAHELYLFELLVYSSHKVQCVTSSSLFCLQIFVLKRATNYNNFGIYMSGSLDQCDGVRNETLLVGSPPGCLVLLLLVGILTTQGYFENYHFK